MCEQTVKTAYRTYSIHDGMYIYVASKKKKKKNNIFMHRLSCLFDALSDTCSSPIEIPFDMYVELDKAHAIYIFTHWCMYLLAQIFIHACIIFRNLWKWNTSKTCPNAHTFHYVLTFLFSLNSSVSSSYMVQRLQNISWYSIRIFDKLLCAYK